MSSSLRMPGVPEAQQDPVLRRYPLRRLRIPVGNGQLSMVVPDDRAWMRQGSWAHEVLGGKEPPYWCRIWPASVAIVRQLCRAQTVSGHEFLSGARVLDLGCGLGLPGIQAAGLGARVCAADFEADAVRFAQWNAQAQPGLCFPPTSQQVDWALGHVRGTFDLIILSDVTYHVNHHRPVRRQLDEVLAPNGCVLHADPWRDLSTEFLKSLDSRYCGLGWQRRTAFLEHDAVVRLSLMARNSDALSQWQRRLAVPAELVPTWPAAPCGLDEAASPTFTDPIGPATA